MYNDEKHFFSTHYNKPRAEIKLIGAGLKFDIDIYNAVNYSVINVGVPLCI